MIDFVIAALPFVIGGIAVAFTAAYAKDFEKWTLSERKRFEKSIAAGMVLGLGAGTGISVFLPAGKVVSAALIGALCGMAAGSAAGRRKNIK